VIDAARARGLTVAAVLGRPGDPKDVLGVPVTLDPSRVDADSFIVAIGDNSTRAKVFAEWSEAGLTPASVIHPSAVLAEDAAIGVGVMVAAGVIVSTQATIGDNAILNTGCTVDHDAVIGAHAHVGPGVSLCGGVRVGEGSLVGVGASVIPNTEIGSWATVGAGAAVTEAVPDHTVWGGVPAVPLRRDASGA
jgi:sugar O-acyltransferase (sialic acid O-acetyltransferase NeuD family)